MKTITIIINHAEGVISGLVDQRALDQPGLAHIGGLHGTSAKPGTAVQKSTSCKVVKRHGHQHATSIGLACRVTLGQRQNFGWIEAPVPDAKVGHQPLE